MPRIENLGDYYDVAQAQSKLLSTNPYERMEMAGKLADLAQNATSTAVCTVRSNTYLSSYEVTNRIGLQLGFPRLQVPTGKLTLEGNDPVADIVLNCDKMIGTNFDEGLANIKKVVEAPKP